MLNRIATSHQTIERFQSDWDAGYWMIGREAAVAAGVSPQAVSQAATRAGNGVLTLGGQRYYHIAWIAERWVSGNGSRAFDRGVDSYRQWVGQNLVRTADPKE